MTTREVVGEDARVNQVAVGTPVVNIYESGTYQLFRSTLTVLSPRTKAFDISGRLLESVFEFPEMNSVLILRSLSTKS